MTNQQQVEVLKRAYELWAAAGYPEIGALAYCEVARSEVEKRARTDDKEGRRQRPVTHNAA